MTPQCPLSLAPAVEFFGLRFFKTAPCFLQTEVSTTHCPSWPKAMDVHVSVATTPNLSLWVKSLYNIYSEMFAQFQSVCFDELEKHLSVLTPVSSGTALIFACLPSSKRILQTVTLKEVGFQPWIEKSKCYMSAETSIYNLEVEGILLE